MLCSQEQSQAQRANLWLWSQRASCYYLTGFTRGGAMWWCSFLIEPHKSPNKWGFKCKGFQSGYHDFRSTYDSREWFLITPRVKSTLLSSGLGLANCQQLGTLMTKVCHPSQLPLITDTATEGAPPLGAFLFLFDTHIIFASLLLSCPSTLNSENKEEKFIFFKKGNSLWKRVETVKRQMPMFNNIFSPERV